MSVLNIVIFLVATSKSNLIEAYSSHFLSHLEPLESFQVNCDTEQPGAVWNESDNKANIKQEGNETLEVSITLPKIPCDEIYYLVIKLYTLTNNSSLIYANKRIELVPLNTSESDARTGKVSFKNIRNGTFFVKVNLHSNSFLQSKENIWEDNGQFSVSIKSSEIQVKNELQKENRDIYSINIPPVIGLNRDNSASFKITIEPWLTPPFKLLFSIFNPDSNKTVPIMRCLLQNTSMMFSDKMGEVTYDNGSLSAVIYHIDNATHLGISIDNEWCIGKQYTSKGEAYFWNDFECLTTTIINMVKMNFSGITPIHVRQASNQPNSILIWIAILTLFVSIVAIMGLKRNSINSLIIHAFGETTNNNEDQVEGAIVNNSIDFKILLLYARESGSIAEEIHKFRELLMENLKCEVIDIFSDSYEQELNIKGIGYLLELLNSNTRNANKIKIILIHSNWSAMLYQANQSGRVIMAQPEEPFDSFYLNGISTIEQDFASYDYANIFNVEFAKFPVANRDQRLKVNSLANYIVPTHNDMLFRAIVGN